MNKIIKTIKYLVLLTSFVFISCATLQNDIYISTEDNAYIYSSIEYYETGFIKIDCAYQLEQNNALNDTKTLLSEITEYLSGAKMAEPVLKARLTALKGLLHEMNGDKAESQTCYRAAKALQATDRYVLLLGVRLEKDDSARLEACHDILKIDSQNPVILLETAKILLRKGEYKNAVAKIDEALIKFNQENLEIYTEVYNPLKEYAWNLYSVTNSNSTKISHKNLTQPLTVSSMVELSFQNSTLFDNYKSSANQKTEKLISILKNERYFSAPVDHHDENASSEELLGSDFISRRLCARFLWNTFVKKQGDSSLYTKYSTRYQLSGRSRSPIADISVSNVDFDAILGVVENEIMELPDGKNFYPNKSVTMLDFLKWIKKIEE